MAGQVTKWNGSFGWIDPLEPVPHMPNFSGQIYLGSSDVDNPAVVRDGTQVMFFVYSDAKGLGAEEATVVDLTVQPSRALETLPVQKNGTGDTLAVPAQANPEAAPT